jgi:hypothetical protein
MAANGFAGKGANLVQCFHFKRQGLYEGMVILERGKAQFIVDSDVRRGSRSVFAPEAHTLFAFVFHSASPALEN